jgi:hypothetical protein
VFLVGALAMRVALLGPDYAPWPAPPFAQPDWINAKADLPLPALLHALALAWLVARIVPREAVWMRTWLAARVAQIGRHSLEVFCLGLFLGFTAADLGNRDGIDEFKAGELMAGGNGGTHVQTGGLNLVEFRREQGISDKGSESKFWAYYYDKQVKKGDHPHRHEADVQNYFTTLGYNHEPEVSSPERTVAARGLTAGLFDAHHGGHREAGADGHDAGHGESLNNGQSDGHADGEAHPSAAGAAESNDDTPAAEPETTESAQGDHGGNT